MDDSERADILDSRDYLLEKTTSLWFFNPLVLDDVVEKFAARCELHD
jgi:hypothetical protein